MSSEATKTERDQTIKLDVSAKVYPTKDPKQEMADVLQEVRIFPDGRIETVWNYRDELEKLILDLQGGQQDGETKSLDLLQGRTS